MKYWEKKNSNNTAGDFPPPQYKTTMNKRYIICYRTENGGKDVVERHTATKTSITRTARDIASFSRTMVVYEIIEEGKQ